MSKFRFRSYLDDGLFVVLIMAAALCAGALQAGALMGAFSSESARMAKAAAPTDAVKVAAAAASSADAAFIGAALARSR